MKKLAVVALGGNALLRNNQIGTIQEQESNTRETLKNLIFLIKENYDLVITHGNGPQVGNILMQNDAGEILYNIPQMPMDVCVADSQGSIAYMIEKELRNLLKEENIEKDIISLITQIVVDKNDIAFKNPKKRIGKIYPKKEAEKLEKEKSWIFKKSPKVKDGWRRVVPSPKPIEIFNIKTIEKIARSGAIIIASGGGGIPVHLSDNKFFKSSEAVIDKDASSSLLASKINANEFYILTDVPYVFLDFNKKNQKKLEFLNKNDAEKYLREGKFGEGNMSPKIIASLDFIKNGGEKSVITEATKLEDKTFGTKITMEYENF